MKTGISASLPEDLYQEFVARARDFPGGKTGLIKEALRAYFSTVSMATPQIFLPQETQPDAPFSPPLI